MNFEDYETLPTNNVLTDMTAGAIAGIMEHCVMYPLDSVKTRMQSLASPTREGISETFLRMIRHEGLLRPVRGMASVVLGAGPAHAFYFSSYEFLKDTLIMRTNTSTYHTLIYGASGCISTLIHDAIMNPSEVVKQRMQMYNSPYASVLDCVRQIYRAEGFKAFYRSYTTQLTMNIPFQSIHFMVYEFSQKITNEDRKYNPVAHMVSGALAGGVAAAVTTPLDVCKTILNTQQGEKTKGMIEAARTVYRLRGTMGYFRGLQARILFQMPSTAICWSTYEFFKYFLGHSRLDDVRLVGSSTVHAEGDKPVKNEQSSSPPAETMGFKHRELPAMSGAGLYGSISFNTMHNADTNFNGRRKDSILDITHT